MKRGRSVVAVVLAVVWILSGVAFFGACSAETPDHQGRHASHNAPACCGCCEQPGSAPSGASADLATGENGGPHDCACLAAPSHRTETALLATEVSQRDREPESIQAIAPCDASPVRLQVTSEREEPAPHHPVLLVKAGTGVRAPPSA